LRLTTKSSSKN